MKFGKFLQSDLAARFFVNHNLPASYPTRRKATTPNATTRFTVHIVIANPISKTVRAHYKFYLSSGVHRFAPFVR